MVVLATAEPSRAMPGLAAPQAAGHLTQSDLLLYIGLGVLGLGVILAVTVILYQLLGRRSALSHRLRQLGAFSGGKAPAPTTPQDGSVVMRTALALSEKAAQRQGQGRLEAALDRAGMALRPAEWILARFIVSLIVAAVLAVALPWWWVGTLLGLLAGWGLTAFYLKFRIKRRVRKFGDVLPEALQLVVSALRSGFSLAQSIDALVKEGAEPVASEFGRAMAEIRLGGEIEDALERTAARNQNRDLLWLVMAIRIQREVGGNLSEVLQTAVETMRERGRLTRHVRGLSAEGRLSAYVLVGMPVCVSAWLMMSRGSYMRPLYTQPIGWMMLAGSVLLIVVGAFWISRLVKVEV